jgi:hypothetical protein
MNEAAACVANKAALHAPLYPLGSSLYCGPAAVHSSTTLIPSARGSGCDQQLCRFGGFRAVAVWSELGGWGAGFYWQR